MTMLEKAARAAWDQRRKKASEFMPGLPLEEWGDGTIPKLNGLMEEVVAVLTAIRESNDAMLEAWDAVGIDRDPRDYWPAGIDAILEEKA